LRNGIELPHGRIQMGSQPPNELFTDKKAYKAVEKCDQIRCHIPLKWLKTPEFILPTSVDCLERQTMYTWCIEN